MWDGEWGTQPDLSGLLYLVVPGSWIIPNRFRPPDTKGLSQNLMKTGQRVIRVPGDSLLRAAPTPCLTVSLTMRHAACVGAIRSSKPPLVVSPEGTGAALHAGLASDPCVGCP